MRQKQRTERVSRRTRGALALAAVVAVAAAAAGCSSSGSASPAAGKQVSGTAKQTIVFATNGLGGEGTATQAAVAAFEKANPNIKVQILSLSSLSDVALQQLEQSFISGATTPDVMSVDITYPAAFARAGWISNLSKDSPNTGAFFSSMVDTGKYKGGLYALPWFINAEGLYYRTDLIKTPPTTIAEVVADAKAAVAKDKSLKEGLAFEGNKYEGAVTVLQSMGANLSTLSNLNTPANVAALKFMSDAINTYKIAPQAATTWTEGQVQAAWLSGQAAMATNWPYIYPLSEAKGSPVAGKTAWIPFPSASGGPAQSSLGGDDLAINAKSPHQAAAWKFIQFLTSPSVELTRAIAVGDPPSLTGDYTSALLSKAPYFGQEEAVYKAAVARPVTPVYTEISSDLQSMISSVLSGQETAAAGLTATAPDVAGLAQTAG